MKTIGSDLKLGINVENIGGDLHLADCEFQVTFFTSKSKKVTIDKKDLIKVDDDNYVATINSNDVGIGILNMTMELFIPDHDFIDGYRREINTVCTGVTIQNLNVIN